MKVLRISKEIEVLMGSIGAFQSLFMSTYLFFHRKRNIQNILLSLFFLLITLRIVKSLLWVYLDLVPDWFLNLGFAAHTASGPILLLYFLHYIHPRPWNPIHFLHFVPALLLLLFLFNINESNFWYRGGYSALLYQQLIYTLIAIGLFVHVLFKKNTSGMDVKDRWWLFLLLAGAGSIQIAYFSNYILGLTPYLAGPVIYAVFIYVIALFGLLNKKVLFKEAFSSRYNNIKIGDAEFNTSKIQIAALMQNEKPYLDPAFSLDKLSRSVTLPSYLASHIINKGFNTNFSDFINSYRIEEAKLKLMSPQYDRIKISEIAYECGFNSLSSFNKAFKKHVGRTPSEFKKSI
ncbi:helix-turn-helix domain-containing protein [Leptobacterium flavescens]|uniref:Helix-turn-helix domain-containing protein n=1 Tax=Leptobacterium flavescens TaxID=472055 RepID=A0A6P0URN3_9FLAO|nr:AraC family transcriptional regulator [Leptobacterium flavescens]NER15202.1 helix-turn-helix domain-containing protein [Leptobacterium flavescens]